jgi:hypothetical protein
MSVTINLTPAKERDRLKTRMVTIYGRLKKEISDDAVAAIHAILDEADA